MSETGTQRSIGEVAVELGFLSHAQLEEAQEVQRKVSELGVPEDLAGILKKRGLLDDDQIRTCREALSPKKVMAGFEILARVGHGAMGTVYKARQLSMDRIVALKVLPKDLSQDPTFKERFIREARASGQLDHLNIVHGIDVGEHKGVAYFAMEFVDGPTVKSILKTQGAYTWQEAVRIAIQVAEALAYAWSRGLVHRDVKPDNVMIARDGTAKLCDLGLAKSTTKPDESELTRSGQAVGTPHYISPEQAKGKRDIDTRSDIYSLGASLYHMLTGRVPFKETSGTAVMVMHVTDEAPSPRQWVAGIPADLELAVAKAMAKDRKDRYQEPHEFAEDLVRILEGERPYYALGFQARSSCAYQPSQEAPHAGPPPEPSRRVSKTGRHARITGRHKRIPTGSHEPVGAQEGSRAAKPKPASASSGRMKVKTAKASGKLQAEPRPSGSGAVDVAEPRPSGSGAVDVAEPAHNPPAAAPQDAKGPMLLWWALSVAALFAGTLLGFRMPLHGSPRSPSSDAPPQSASRTEDAKSRTEPEPAAGVIIEPDRKPPKPPTQLTPIPRPPDPVLPVPLTPPDAIATRPPSIAKAPKPPPPELNVNLEEEARKAFDTVTRHFARGDAAAAKPLLDKLQKDFDQTAWYAANRSLVDAAYFRLEHAQKPWAPLFAGVAVPAGEPSAEAWELIYDQLTFVPNQQQEWQLLPGTKVLWKAGWMDLTPSGAEHGGIVLGVPMQEVERIEAVFRPAANAEYGWAVFSDVRGSPPLAKCVYAADGSIRFWANEVEKTLKLRMPEGADERRVIVRFRPRKAWVEVDGASEEIDLPASPSARMIPGLIAGKALVKLGSVNLHGRFEAEYAQRLLEERNRVERLKKEARKARAKVKITVASEFPAAVFVGKERAKPDTPGNFEAKEYIFTLPVGSVISVRQFPPKGSPGGYVLLDVGADGKHTGTGLSPYCWWAAAEQGAWQTDPATHAGWHRAIKLDLPGEVRQRQPAGTKAEFTWPFNKGFVLRYVFDSDDLK